MLTLYFPHWRTPHSLFYALFLSLITVGVWTRYGQLLDYYEVLILLGSTPALIALGWFWPALQRLVIGMMLLSALGIWSYQGELAQAQNHFLLKYFLSSQSALLWMVVLFAISTVFYWLAFVVRSQRQVLQILGSKFTWMAVLAALVGTMLRWYESYLVSSDIGHIPISNLYEVFVLFCWMTALFYLYYEQVSRTYSLGAFVMIIISAALVFLIWYTLERQAQEIQPLVPALQSWWMKLHVPANFIGYGTFSIAAMLSFAYLLKLYARQPLGWKVILLALLGVVLALDPLFFRRSGVSMFWGFYFAGCLAFVILLIYKRRFIARQLPSFRVIDDIMYRAIAVGFAFFTLATILGALWAADAWGGYWSWDPKETWALIVWLNYAAWLHMRLIKGLRGEVACWWSLTGLGITSFAFLGVNMFLSGLHSYGTL